MKERTYNIFNMDVVTILRRIESHDSSFNRRQERMKSEYYVWNQCWYAISRMITKSWCFYNLKWFYKDINPKPIF